jgi:hypothetical protein
LGQHFFASGPRVFLQVALKISMGVKMRNMVYTALLSACVIGHAAAAESKGNVGINSSTNETYGIQGEVNISSLVNNAPVSVQVFWKKYSDNYWRITTTGIAGIYDFSSIAKLGEKAHPYVGIGLMTVSNSWIGTGTQAPYGGVDSGWYESAGIRYFLTPQLDADFSYNNFGDLTIGVNFNF